MFNFLFSSSERALLARAAKTNDDELLYWRLPNLIYPFAVIGISLICYGLFKPDDKFTWIGLLNLILNGSLPMVALNRMNSLGSNLFKFDKSKEISKSTNTVGLRVKIDDYSKILLVCISILYIYQVIKTPFSITWWLLIHLLFSGLFIILSLRFSKYAYLLQERLMDRTIGDDIRDTANQTKKHLFDKYGEE